MVLQSYSTKIKWLLKKKKHKTYRPKLKELQLPILSWRPEFLLLPETKKESKLKGHTGYFLYHFNFMILYYLQLWYYEINFIFSNRIFLSFLFYSSYIDTYSYTYLKKKWPSLPSHGPTPLPHRSSSTNTVVTHCFLIAQNVHIGYCSKYSYSYWKVPQDVWEFIASFPSSHVSWGSFHSKLFYYLSATAPQHAGVHSHTHAQIICHSIKLLRTTGAQILLKYCSKYQ